MGYGFAVLGYLMPWVLIWAYFGGFVIWFWMGMVCGGPVVVGICLMVFCDGPMVVDGGWV